MKKIYKVIRLQLIAQEAKLGPPLTTILGQLNINTGDFCNLFNDYSLNYAKGTPLTITLWFDRFGNFDFIINPINLHILCEDIENDNDNLKLISLYKIFLIRSFESGIVLYSKFTFKEYLNNIYDYVELNYY